MVQNHPPEIQKSLFSQSENTKSNVDWHCQKCGEECHILWPTKYIGEVCYHCIQKYRPKLLDKGPPKEIIDKELEKKYQFDKDNNVRLY